MLSQKNCASWISSGLENLPQMQELKGGSRERKRENVSGSPPTVVCSWRERETEHLPGWAFSMRSDWCLDRHEATWEFYGTSINSTWHSISLFSCYLHSHILDEAWTSKGIFWLTSRRLELHLGQGKGHVVWQVAPAQQTWLTACHARVSTWYSVSMLPCFVSPRLPTQGNLWEFPIMGPLICGLHGAAPLCSHSILHYPPLSSDS